LQNKTYLGRAPANVGRQAADVAMTDAVIIGAARTPIGGEAGRTLTRIHPVDLHAHVIRSLIERTGVSPRPRTM